MEKYGTIFSKQASKRIVYPFGGEYDKIGRHCCMGILPMRQCRCAFLGGRAQCSAVVFDSQSYKTISPNLKRRYDYDNEQTQYI